MPTLTRYENLTALGKLKDRALYREEVIKLFNKGTIQSATSAAEYLKETYNIQVVPRNLKAALKEHHGSDIPLSDPESVEDSELTISEQVKHDRQIAGLKAQVDVYKRKYESVLKESNLEAAVVELMRDYRDQMPVPKVPQLNTEAPKRVKTKETLCIVISDTHTGEEVSEEAMHGINKYDHIVFISRMDAYFEKIKSIALENMAGFEFEEVHLYLLGDLVNGMYGAMHDELIITQSADLMESVYGTAYVLVQFIALLRQFFGKVVVCAAPGNHGRMSRKPMHKMPHMNWDMIIPQIASSFFFNDKNVVWNIPKSFFFIDQIYGETFLGLHGHQVKGWASIPWYGINKTVGNLVTAMDQQKMNELEREAKEKGQISIDLTDLQSLRINNVVMGHFHQEALFERVGGAVMASGCMKGPDEFSLGSGFSPSPASQLMFGVHRNEGVTHRWNMHLQNYYEPKGVFEWWSGEDIGSAWEKVLQD